MRVSERLQTLLINIQAARKVCGQPTGSLGYHSEDVAKLFEVAIEDALKEEAETDSDSESILPWLLTGLGAGLVTILISAFLPTVWWSLLLWFVFGLIALMNVFVGGMAIVRRYF